MSPGSVPDALRKAIGDSSGAWVPVITYETRLSSGVPTLTWPNRYLGSEPDDGIFSYFSAFEINKRLFKKKRFSLRILLKQLR